MALSTQTDFFLNLSQLSGLKLDARNKDADASRSVAQQFESLFIQQMLGAMRSAARIDESNHSSYTDFYQEMHDKQLALTLANQGGLGLTKFIMQQLPGGQKDAIQSGQSLPLHEYREVMRAPAVPKMDYKPENPSVIVKPLVLDDAASIKAKEQHSDLRGNWESSREFVREVLPQAKVAAEALGISPALLVAQSALETGWGKHVMTRADGSPTFNLFGIKAGGGWTGETVTRPTLEFRNGVMQTEIAHFRAYSSAGESLKDYVDFIQTNSRYRHALQHEGSDQHYIRGLQKAGYATDPHYADKILSILGRDEFHDAVNGGAIHA